jgi:hypothetical protein
LALKSAASFSPSATLFHASLSLNFHKAQALSERHIDVLAKNGFMWAAPA